MALKHLITKTTYPLIKENAYPNGTFSAIQVEKVILVDSYGFFITGWKSDTQNHIQKITINITYANTRYQVNISNKFIEQYRNDIYEMLLESTVYPGCQPLGFVVFIPWQKISSQFAGMELSQQQLKNLLFLVTFDTEKIYSLPLVLDNQLTPQIKLDEHLIFPLIESINTSRTTITGPISSVLKAKLNQQLVKLEKDFHLTEHDTVPTPIHINFDAAYVVPDQGVFFSGWKVIPDNAIDEIYLCCLNHKPIPMTDCFDEITRNDINKLYKNLSFVYKHSRLGYYAFVQAKWSEKDFKHAYINIYLNNKQTFQLKIRKLPTPTCFSPDFIKHLLLPLENFNKSNRNILKTSLYPLISRMMGNNISTSIKPEVKVYGHIPDKPEVSIIVTVYSRLDLMQYQLALFANDWELKAVELIYILDNPTLNNEFNRFCVENYPVYQQPFVTISNKKNIGFSAINNFVASLAKGKKLLFLNAGVFPKQPGWLSKLINAYDTLANPGILTPKLLDANNNERYTEIIFEGLPEWDQLIINEHPFQYLHDSNSNGKKIIKIKAATAACMLIDRKIYLQHRGFDEGYISGDIEDNFKDADLCLKLLDSGKNNFYHAGIELYHLKTKPFSNQPGSFSTNDSPNRYADYQAYYNCLRFNDKWSEQLAYLSKASSR